MSGWLLLYVALCALSQYDILCQYLDRRNDGYHFKQYCTLHVFQNVDIAVIHNHDDKHPAWSESEISISEMNNPLRCIMFASRLHFVVRPYGLYLMPSCSAFNMGCSTVENNYGNSALIKCSDWYNTAIMNCLVKITCLWQSQRSSCRLVVAPSQKVLLLFLCYLTSKQHKQASMPSLTTKSWDGIIC